jgi:hypothetical protein
MSDQELLQVGSEKDCRTRRLQIQKQCDKPQHSCLAGPKTPWLVLLQVGRAAAAADIVAVAFACCGLHLYRKKGM